jgi:hypothetical protein
MAKLRESAAEEIVDESAGKEAVASGAEQLSAARLVLSTRASPHIGAFLPRRAAGKSVKAHISR